MYEVTESSSGPAPTLRERFLTTITTPAMQARFDVLAEEQPAVRITRWMLEHTLSLEWLHCIGVVQDAALAQLAPPVPPHELRAITAAADAEDFLWSGLVDLLDFLELYERHRRATPARPRVLDFGCGCGRLTRFLDRHTGYETVACDLNPAHVAWCTENLRHVTTLVNDAQPPLPFAEHSIDFAYALSLFTHVPEAPALAWLADLGRIIRPGGVLIITTHGYPALETIRGSRMHRDMFELDQAAVASIEATLPQRGYLFCPYRSEVRARANIVTDYGNAFVDPAVVHGWSGTFEVVAQIAGGLRGWQDIHVLRRRDVPAQLAQIEGRGELARLFPERSRNTEIPGTQLAGREAHHVPLRAVPAPTAGEIASLEAKLAGVQAELADASERLAEYAAEEAYARSLADVLEDELERAWRELQSLTASSSWRLTLPLRRLSAALPRLAKVGRGLLPGRGTEPRPHLEGAFLYHRSVGLAGPSTLTYLTNAAEHYLMVARRRGMEPGPQFDATFLYPYYRSVGFAGPPTLTYLTLRALGWPVYATHTEAEAVAARIRTSDLFDALTYPARVGELGELDPALHYVIVGERTGVIPSEAFDPEYYGDRYSDIGCLAVNRLDHYIRSGRAEGRRPLPVAATFAYDKSRLKPNRDTVLLVSHDASRTGGPILTYNIAKRLGRRYNVIGVLLGGGDLIPDFEATCAAAIGSLAQPDVHPAEVKQLVKYINAAYAPSYAIVNSIESAVIVPPLVSAFIPVILLVHEFASYTRPKLKMKQGLEWATEIVFSAGLVARSASEDHPTLAHRSIHILPQGRTDRPPARESSAGSTMPPDVSHIFRPPGAERAFVVMGCGFVHIRKGIDLFISCAATVATLLPARPVRFVWVGKGYDPENDVSYSSYLAHQIARSGLEFTLEFTGELADVDSAYALADLFFLCSRLDPLPNVAIDAALNGLPVICFDGASGIADIFGADPSTSECVLPHLDVRAAANLIVDLANDEDRHRRLAEAFRNLGRATFDMDRYVRKLRELGTGAVGIMHQRTRDLTTLSEDPIFDPDMYLPVDAGPTPRKEAIIEFLVKWTAQGTAGNPEFRRPCIGFHPQVYAHLHASTYDAITINPLAHFIRNRKPEGPWCHDVITPRSIRTVGETHRLPRTALHAHFYYPELAEDFFRKLAVNECPCDILLSTDEKDKEKVLRKVAVSYQRDDVRICVVPNRGRDIGALLTAFAEDLREYDIIGHLHGKRSVHLSNPSDLHFGDRWREFLWQTLLGGRYNMMDIIIRHLTSNETVGLIFAEDPYLCDWCDNRPTSEELAARMGIAEPLPPFFDFPNGTMFWARTDALRALLDLNLGWGDYPQEPAPPDGTILHAIERLLPFVARHAGYRYATTHVPGVTR